MLQIIPLLFAHKNKFNSFQFELRNQKLCHALTSSPKPTDEFLGEAQIKLFNDRNIISEPKPFYCLHHFNIDRYEIFQAVENVLTRLDYEKTEVNLSTIHESRCDLLWSYQLHDIETTVKWNQLGYFKKVNHIPGNFHLTSKSIFGVNTTSKYVPKSFTDSKKLLKYATEYPKKKFVIKLKSNRGIKLVENISDVDFTENPFDLTGYFGQEFIDNPLLFDGHKFDFGIFVAVTSVKPLRLYYYTKNMIIRFCRKKYSTRNPDDTESYVIGANIIPVWDFNGTRNFHEAGYSTKDIFEDILQKSSVNVGDIWKKIEEAIKEIVVSKEKLFCKSVSILDKEF